MGLDTLGVMIECRAVVAFIENDYRILLCCLTRLKPLNRQAFAMKATENSIIVVEELFKVSCRNCHAPVALEVLRNEQGVMRRFRHNSARETRRRDNGPLCSHTLPEKRDSARVRRLVPLDFVRRHPF